jgi:preprotein translocase subunit SecE
MNAKAEVESSGMDTAKLIVAGLLLAAGIGGFYYFEGHSLLLRVLGMLVAAGAGAAVALQTTSGRRLWRFGGEARVELRKVVWPSRQETLQTTLVVLVLVLIMGLFLWAVDSILFHVVKALTGQGG